MPAPTTVLCPNCENAMERGFAVRWSGLSFIEPRKFGHFTFIDHDLSGAGWRKYLPWKAAYYRAYVCRSCRLYMADYGTSLSRREADTVAADLH